MASYDPSKWTREMDKAFERALVEFTDHNGETRWEKVAEAVGNDTSVEHVKLHYEILLEDVNNIEAGLVPLPNYSDSYSYDKTDDGTDNETKYVADNFSTGTHVIVPHVDAAKKRSKDRIKKRR